MNYVSVCSGIEAATVAWHPLGWKPLAFAEIAKFPSAVLAHHYPDVRNHGDFTSINGLAADLLVGGTPCQSFSVAGLRGGLADERGNLALEYCRLAERLRARWIVWENVPGVLSSNGGRDFGSILGALVKLGYGVAYRVLDAQFFGVPQRRRRVFVVGYLGDWRRAAAVLFERSCLRWDPQPRRKARADATTYAISSVAGSRGNGTGVAAEVSYTLDTQDPHAVAYPIAFHPTQDPISGAMSPCLSRTVDGMGVAHTITAHHGRNDGESNYVASGYRVRRLTPRECERLQGFPDDYTAIPGAADSPRYRALGNSMAVPCMRWIGERIARVEAVPRGPERRQADSLIIRSPSTDRRSP